ncbi:Msx2-interacting protein [Dirofilaria immitis]|nr:Msx2-interacting protein [Dirofilaria immitis]
MVQKMKELKKWREKIEDRSGLVNSTTPSNSVSLDSPQNARNASSSSTTTDSHRRSSDLHSPNSSSSKQIQKERQVIYTMSQHRFSSSSSRRQSRERERDRERGSSNRADERSQRSRTSGNNDRRIGASDSRTARRSRYSPRASASSDSSRDSASPSESSGHHHHSSNTHTVQSTVIKLGASCSRRSDANASNELSASCGNHDSLSGDIQSIQGIYVSNLPSSRTEGFLRDGLTNFFKKYGKVVHIMFETESGSNFVEQRRALVIFQRLMDADKLKDVHHLFGLRLKIRFASHSAVTEAYNTYLSTNGQECLSSQDTASTSSSSIVDALASRASRTLYVGGLERRTTDDSLRSRFSYFGHILETEVKNWESPSPFAFIQFADINSVVCAINAYAQSAHSSAGKGKLKMNWGRTIVSNKIWIGELPSSCSADYLREKIRVSFTDTFNEVIYDPRHREALLLFSNNESAQRAFSMIKTKQVAFWNADEKKDVHVPVDYCSEKLHDYFVDRKFRGESGNARKFFVVYRYRFCKKKQWGSAIASTSTSLLAPPPDPPSHLRDTSSRADCRRLGSNVSRGRRSDEREDCRNSSRSLRYSSYNRSRRRRERTRRNDVSPSSSSTSSSSTDSDLSNSSTPDRKHTGSSHSKSNIQRLHRDKTPIYPSGSRQPSSPNSKPDRNFEDINSTIGVTSQTGTSRSGTRAASLTQLLPPVPSAPILNSATLTSSSEKRSNKNITGSIDLRHQQSMPSLSLLAGDDFSHEASGKSTAEQQSKTVGQQQQESDAKQLENKGSHSSGFYNSAVQGNFTANEISAITSNRIEEIANTLVNVLQHHSKASTSTTASAPLAIMSGTHSSHSSVCSVQRSTDDACDSGRHHSSKQPLFSKRTKWPWGNDPIKNHCAIPLDGSANRGRDPRYRKYSPQTSTSLLLPKFVHDHHSAPSSSRRNNVPDAFRSPQQQKQDSKCSKILYSLQISVLLVGCSLKWNPTENSPPQKVTRVRTHSSMSRSESSNSEAMLSPDPSNSTAQPSLVTSTIDIFGDTSPANNSNAYRERLDALGATFQNIEQKFQKTKQNTHLDYDRKGLSQRSYKFEEELERLKARAGSSSSNVTTPQSITTCSHSTSSTFTDSFTKARSSGSGTTSVFDSKDAESQKLNRTLLSLSIPMPPAPVTSINSNHYTTVLYTTYTNSSSLPSPQFSGAQLRKPLVPPAITQSSNQIPSSTATPHIAYPPDFSIPPPPLPQFPVLPTLSLASYKSATDTSLISAPPPPPPLVCSSTSNSFDSTSPCFATSLLVRSAGSQSSLQSSPWRTATKSSTPPLPVVYSNTNSKQTSSSSASSTSKPSVSGSISSSTVLEDKMRSRVQGTDKVQVREKEHLKTSSKAHMPEKRTSKDSTNKQPSLSELFRQQAQDSSEVLKQLKKVRKEKGSKAENDCPEANEGKKERKQLKEKDREHEGGEVSSEKRKIQKPMEKNITSKAMKDSATVKHKEKVKEEEHLQKFQAKKETKKESSTSSSEETSSSEVELHSFDRELKRLFMEEEASGSLGLSMYDRVKQRSSSKPDDAARKNRALELLQERTQSRRNNEQNRPKRVQLESSSSDEDRDSSNDEVSDSSGPSVDASRLLVEDETESNDIDGDGEDDDGIEKDSEKSELDDECPKRKRNRKIATSKAYKKPKKTTSLSLDDVFGTYSTDDESTKHSRAKTDENLKTRSVKEKTENTRRLGLKKERKRESWTKVMKANLVQMEEKGITAAGFALLCFSLTIALRKGESKQFLDKTVEKKVAGKSDSAREKSLVEISMFREDDRKKIKTASVIPEQKKKVGNLQQMDNLKRSKTKDEKLEDESHREKVDRASNGSSDDAGKSDVIGLNDRSPKTIIQNHELSSTKGARKRHLKVENSEEIKKSKKAPKSSKTCTSQTDSDSSEDLKTTDVDVVKQEPSSELPIKTGVNNENDSTFKSESKRDSPPGCTNIGLDLLQSTRMAVPSASTTVEMEHTEVDFVSEECITNASYSSSNECCLPRTMPHDETDQSKKMIQ